MQADDIVFSRTFTAEPNYTYTFEIYGTVVRSYQLSDMAFPIRVVSQGQVIASTNFVFSNDWYAETETVSFDLTGIISGRFNCST